MDCKDAAKKSSQVHWVWNTFQGFGSFISAIQFAIALDKILKVQEAKQRNQPKHIRSSIGWKDLDLLFLQSICNLTGLQKYSRTQDAEQRNRVRSIGVEYLSRIWIFYFCNPFCNLTGLQK